jgi:hypothetical protein
LSPKKLSNGLEHKLAAYTWNLVENCETDFVTTAHELDADGRTKPPRIGQRQ